MAGTFLHFLLSKKEKNVLVIDDNFNKNSSLVAAGMFNPIVFKRLNKSWNADKFSPFLINFFQEMESFLGLKLKTDLDIVRIFSSMENQNDWETKLGDENFKDYLSNETTKELTENKIEHKYGYGIVKKGGWVNTKSFLFGYREFLEKENLIWSEKFDYDSLVVQNKSITYKGIKASKIIFCEGTQGKDNPFFKYLPFKPTKGEVLTVKINEFTFSKMANKGFFMLPLGNNIYRIGATYNWQDKTYETTEEGRDELVAKIKSVINQDFEIIGQQAGIRPTVKDRKPFIGIHPKHSALGIFNGLGTKGILNGPFYAEQFSSFLVHNSELDSEVAIKRYAKYYDF